MNLGEVSIKRPVFISMVLLACVVLGLTSLNRMSVDLFPDVDIPYVTVITIYPGASPEEIETQVADELEDSLKTLSDLEEMTSESVESVSMIVLEFSTEADLEEKTADVRDAIEGIKNNLPDDAEDPQVMKLNLDSFPIIFAAVSAKRHPSEVKKTTDDLIKPYMERLKGVASIGVSGGLEREIHVNVDRNKLFGYNLSILQVVEALAKDNLDIPAGKIKKGTDESLVRVLGEYVTVDEIQNIYIPSPLGLIKVKDIAEVSDNYKDVSTYSRLNGYNAVSLQVIKQSDANTVATARAAKQAMKEMVGKAEGVKAILPADYQVEVASDMSQFIEDALSDVKQNLLYGCIFATLMVFLFLRDPRSTLIVFLAIPIAIVSSFMPMYAAGFSINFMSLMGMSLAVGTLVDNSIVVLENIFRHLEMGKNPVQAAGDGLKEVGLAVLVSGTTNLCVFMSVAFMSGMIGSFFKEFGLTIAFATLFAIFVAFTLTPAMAARMFKARVDENGNKINGNGGDGFGTKIVNTIFLPLTIPFDIFFGAIRKGYPGLLRFSMRYRWVPVLFVVVLFASSIFAAKFVDQEYVPSADQGEIYVLFEMPSYASLDDTNKVAMRVEKILGDIPEVKVYSSSVGSKISRGSLEGQSQPRYGWTTVKLAEFEDRDRSTEDIVRIIRKKVAEIPDTIFQVSQSSMGGPPGELPLIVDVVGPELNTVIELSEKVKKIVGDTPGALDVSSNWNGGKSEIKIYPDKEKLATMGLDVATLGYTVRVSLEGDDSIQFKEKGDEYDIRIRFDGMERESVEDVKAIPLMTQNGAIRLDNVADIRQELGAVNISRKNGQPAIRIQGNLGDETIDTVVKEIEKRVIKENILPPGYDIEFEGQYAEMQETGKEMGMAMGLAILFVFMVMAAQFESLLYPLVVILTLPLTFIGVVYALLISGKTFNMMTQIAIVMLIGIVVNNGILLVDFINQIRARGVPRNNAILEAGPLRLRPIMITSFSTIGAMIPAAFFGGSGGGFRTPMAIVAIGGMVVSTFLTLIFIPVAYSLIDDLPRLLKRIIGRQVDKVWATDRKGAPPPPEESAE